MRYRCTDPHCNVRCTTESKGSKHAAKTGHTLTLNLRATSAHLKYMARQNPTYLDRLRLRDHQLDGVPQ